MPVMPRPEGCGGTTMKGFVLANVRAGSETEFFRSLGDFGEVLRVYYLFDDFDYLVEVEGSSVEELAHVMRNRLRHLPGVERTAMFMEGGLRRFPPMERESEVREPGLTVF